MSLSTTSARIQYNGDAVTTIFAVPFYFIKNSDLKVYVDGVLKTLTTDYSVSGAGVQAGGSITMVSAPALGTANVILIRDPDQLQSTQLPSNDPFPSKSVETALDKLTMLVQRAADALSRSLHLSEFLPNTILTELPTPDAGKALVWTPDALGITNSSAKIDDVYNLCQFEADLATAAASSASASAASAASSYDQFDDRYLGSKSSDPALDNDGNALSSGALYWNTSSLKLRIYNGAAWQDTATAVAASYITQVFSGNGALVNFTLSSAPAGISSLFVYVTGARKNPTLDYTISGTTLTMAVAPPNAANNLFVMWASSVAVGVPDDLSISTAKIQALAVTGAKLDDQFVNDLTTVTIASGDLVPIADVSDTNKKKKGLVSDIVALAVAAAASFPTGTRMSFQQTAAPTGWTKDVTAAINDGICRLVTGTAANGGSLAFSTWAAVTTVGATTLTAAQIPSHTHPELVLGSQAYQNGVSSFFGFSNVNNRSNATPEVTGPAGSGGSHTHSVSRSLKYYDFIIASKN